MEIDRQKWNESLKTLRRLLEDCSDHSRAVELCLTLHAQVHAAAVSGIGLWSFEDEVLDDLSDVALRTVPSSSEHSIAWILWHIARIEDITMNMLAAGRSTVFADEGWARRLHGTVDHSGNAMNPDAVRVFSETVNTLALKEYRQAVGRRTRQLIPQISFEALKIRVLPKRLEMVKDQKLVLPEAQEVMDYWASRTIAGLLLMPATRHSFTHLNEALRLRPKVIRE